MIRFRLPVCNGLLVDDYLRLLSAAHPMIVFSRRIDSSPVFTMKLPIEAPIDHGELNLGFSSVTIMVYKLESSLQINLHHCKAASAALLIHLAENGADIVLVQKPWIAGGSVTGQATREYKILEARTEVKKKKTEAR